MKTYKLPWLVQQRDLQRYLGRAFDACMSGRVVFFFHQYQGKKRLLWLSSYPGSEDALVAAGVDFAKGKYRSVVLANLTPRTRR